MMDWLIRIPGPEFLAGYVTLNAVFLFVIWYIRRSDDGRYSPPDPNRFDPIAFAALRGGWRAAVDTAIVQLMTRQIVKIEETAGGNQISLQDGIVDLSFLSPVEQIVCKHLMASKGRTGGLLACNFKKGRAGEQVTGVLEKGRMVQELACAVEAALQPVYQDWQEQGLLMSDFRRSISKTMIWLVILLGDGLALAKVIQGVEHHHPSAFLGIAIFVAKIVYLYCFANDQLTWSGRNYIAEVGKQFSWVQSELKDDSASTNYVLGVAVLGISVLASNPLLSPYQAFAYTQVRSGGGCGDDSSDGGSGCSGCGGGGD